MSILSSTNTGQQHINELLKMHGLNPDRAMLNADGSMDYNGDVIWSGKNLSQIPLKFNRVHGDFDVSHNSLISLDNSPKVVDGNFRCIKNKLISLKGGPEEVWRDYDCAYNYSLRSLEGSPAYVGGAFSCNLCCLSSLEGGPKQVDGIYICSSNFLLDLNGLPEDFDCYKLKCEFNFISAKILNKINTNIYNLNQYN